MTTPANVPQCSSRQPPPHAFFPANRSEAMTLVAVDNAVPLARRLVREVLRHWHLDALMEDHELVVSELLTNALKATESFTKSRGSKSPAVSS